MTQIGTDSADSRALDGTELQYTYEDGGEVVLTFYEGQLKFAFLNGPLAGTTHDDLAYRCRELDDGIYFLRWHNTEVNSFVTLHVDLPRRRVFGSALIWYGTENETELFDAAVITDVRHSVDG